MQLYGVIESLFGNPIPSIHAIDRLRAVFGHELLSVTAKDEVSEIGLLGCDVAGCWLLFPEEFAEPSASSREKR